MNNIKCLTDLPISLFQEWNKLWIMKNIVKDIENINNLIYNLDILDIHIFDFEK